MILSFKKQFKDPILKGTKIHTIREDKTGRWKVGNTIQMATGVRTKSYNCFKLSTCHRVQEFAIRYKVSPDFTIATVYVDGLAVGTAYLENCVLKSYTVYIQAIAENDGFKDVNDFLEWFSEDFDGKIIHWTNKRYW